MMDIKVIILGAAAVGKTCLIRRFVDEMFSEYIPYQPSLGSMFYSRAVRRGTQTVIFKLWDTAGEERFVSLTRMFYRGARVALVCYDMTDTRSFERIRLWIDELSKVEEKCRIYICGTKKDMVTEVQIIDPRAVAHYVEEIGAKSIETSSKTGENVDILFEMIATDILESHLTTLPQKKPTLPQKKGRIVALTSETPKKKSRSTVDLTSETPKKKSCC